MKYKLKKFNNKYKYVGGSKKVIDLICNIINPRHHDLYILLDPSLENNIIVTKLIEDIKKISKNFNIEYFEEDVEYIGPQYNYITITPLDMSHNIDIKANKILHILLNDANTNKNPQPVSLTLGAKHIILSYENNTIKNYDNIIDQIKQFIA